MSDSNFYRIPLPSFSHSEYTSRYLRDRHNHVLLCPIYVVLYMYLLYLHHYVLATYHCISIDLYDIAYVHPYVSL